LKEAIDRQDEFVKNNKPYLASSDETAQDLMLKATKVLEHRMNELNARREKLVLKSPFDGIVSQIQGRVGETVLAGGAILTIAEDKPREIIAYASEDQARQIQKGTAVELIKTSEPAQIAKSEVTYLGPNIDQMPVRLWRNPNIPQWGRPILMKIPPGLKLLPGETVGIRGL
jgi:multidrug resistance efflux pump